jgi:hypothetical protein
VQFSPRGFAGSGTRNGSGRVQVLYLPRGCPSGTQNSRSRVNKSPPSLGPLTCNPMYIFQSSSEISSQSPGRLHSASRPLPCRSGADRSRSKLRPSVLCPPLALGIINRTNRDRDEVTETENFGHKFGLQFEVTELTGLKSVITLG